MYEFKDWLNTKETFESLINEITLNRDVEVLTEDFATYIIPFFSHVFFEADEVAAEKVPSYGLSEEARKKVTQAAKIIRYYSMMKRKQQNPEEEGNDLPEGVDPSYIQKMFPKAMEKLGSTLYPLIQRFFSRKYRDQDVADDLTQGLTQRLLSGLTVRSAKGWQEVADDFVKYAISSTKSELHRYMHDKKRSLQPVNWIKHQDRKSQPTAIAAGGDPTQAGSWTGGKRRGGHGAEGGDENATSSGLMASLGYGDESDGGSSTDADKPGSRRRFEQPGMDTMIRDERMKKLHSILSKLAISDNRNDPNVQKMMKKYKGYTPSELAVMALAMRFGLDLDHGVGSSHGNRDIDKDAKAQGDVQDGKYGDVSKLVSDKFASQYGIDIGPASVRAMFSKYLPILRSMLTGQKASPDLSTPLPEDQPKPGAPIPPQSQAQPTVPGPDEPKPGIAKCLKCNKMFTSKDVRSNRVCNRCERLDRIEDMNFTKNYKSMINKET